MPRASSGGEGRFSSRRGEDPLAELARLIGQDDPFADFNNGGQRSARTSHRNGNGNGADLRAPRRDTRHDDNGYYDDRADDYDRQEPSYARGHEGYEEEEYEAPKPQRPAPRVNGNGRGYSYGAPVVDPVDRNPPRTQRVAPRPVRGYEEDEELDDPRYDRAPVDANGYAPRQARAFNDRKPQPQYDENSYDQDFSSEYETEYVEDEYAAEYDEPYIEPSRGGRRWLLLGVMALIGVVVLGVAGLYGYRMIFGRHHFAGTPPTIRSADSPTKVVPSGTQANADAAGQKQIYDRVGGSERIVSREEQPADTNAAVSAPAVTSPVALAQPGGSVSAFAPPAGSASAAPVLNPPAPTNGEPKRVRTMTIRSDGSTADQQALRQAPAAPVKRTAAAPLALNPNVQADQPQDDAADQAAPQQPVRTTTTRITSANAQDSAWAGVQQPAPAAARPQQVSNYIPAGSYVVQVASQKTEADAQTAWRQMQAKYTNVLNNQPVSFKRVDLGDRGTFYRAMVGPFANRDQAYEMCQNLKSAGGECVVQRN